MGSYSQDDNKNGWMSAFIVPAAILGALYAGQTAILNYKAAAAHIDEAISLPAETSAARIQADMAFITGTITATSPVQDVLSTQSIHGYMAVKVIHERYQRSGKNSRSWKTDNRFISTSDRISLGNYLVSPDFLSRNGAELWENVPLDELWPAIARAHPNWTFGNGIVYGQADQTNRIGNERYRYLGIRSPAYITAIGMADSNSAGQPTVAPSPFMPADYPAFWSGEISPTGFIKTLHTRLINFIVMLGGLLLFISWFGQYMLDRILFPHNGLSRLLLPVSALASTMAGLCLCYAVPSLFAATVGCIGLIVASYYLLRFAFGPELKRY